MKREVLRMCVVCRNMKPKAELIRLVISEDLSTCQIGADKVNGRGTYICKNRECIGKCIKSKVLNRVYKKNIPDHIYEELKKVEENVG